MPIPRSGRGVSALLTVGIVGFAALSFIGQAAAQAAYPPYNYNYGNPSSSSSSMATPAPGVAEVQRMIEQRTGLPITWTKVSGWTGVAGTSRQRLRLTGTGTMNQKQGFSIQCTISNPPLKIDCTINFSF